jgi:hypothetical protein
VRVRIAYTEDVTDEFRRAINAYHGEPGLASRQQVREWFWLHGQAMNDDIMYDLGADEEGGQ